MVLEERVGQVMFPKSLCIASSIILIGDTRRHFRTCNLSQMYVDALPTLSAISLRVKGFPPFLVLFVFSTREVTGIPSLKEVGRGGRFKEKSRRG